MDDLTPTRSALLELKEESHSMRDAYSFLDEKRMLLASTLVQQIKLYDKARQALARSFSVALASLQEAVAWHGLDSLQCQPVEPLEISRLLISKSAILGIELIDAVLTSDDKHEASQSPQVRRCARQFRDLTVQAAKLAALSGNMLRLYQEYQRTERRARALEDVLLPELEETTRSINDHLEAMDLEEAVRVRCLRGR